MVGESALKSNANVIDVLPNQVVPRNAVSDLFTVGVTVLFLGFVATTTIAWKIHVKIRTINETADRIITSPDLSRRIPYSKGNNEFDRLARNLNRMLNTIEARVEDIQQLSNNISHDLRTPLTVLRNRLEALEVDPPDWKELTESVDQLLVTFDALQRITRLSTESASLTVQEIDLADIVEDVIDLYLPLAAEKQQTISHRLEQRIAQAGVNLLFQAIANLLENALKFAPVAGSIIVLAELKDDGVEIAVQDNGPGIPEERLHDVVERFVRLEHPNGKSGTGLGLSMVRAIAEIHQGSLELKNVPNGFVAAIALPAKEAN